MNLINFNLVLRKPSLLVLTVLLLNACIEVQNLNDPIQNTVSTFSYEIVDGLVLNQFKVKMKFSNSSQMLVRKNEEGVRESEIIVSNEFVDENVEAGSNYTYEIGNLKQSRFVPVESFQVSIPFDLIIKDRYEINNQLELKKIKNLRNLILEKNSLFITNGNNLELSPIYFESQGGTIQTFPINATAPLGSNGKDGGNLRVHLKSGKGHVTINMHGQNGGQGHSGKDNSSAQGEDGQRGFQGGDSGNLEIANDSDLKIDVYQRPGLGGAGGKGGVGMIKFAKDRSTGEMYEYTFNGKEGPKGEDGQIGQLCDLIENHCIVNGKYTQKTSN